MSPTFALEDLGCLQGSSMCCVHSCSMYCAVQAADILHHVQVQVVCLVASMVTTALVPPRLAALAWVLAQVDSTAPKVPTLLATPRHQCQEVQSTTLMDSLLALVQEWASAPLVVTTLAQELGLVWDLEWVLALAQDTTATTTQLTLVTTLAVAQE